MGDRELGFFEAGNFPAGGYAIPDRKKNGAYFVQARNQFYMFFSEDDNRYTKACKIPGDVVRGVFRAGPQSQR